MRSLFKIIVIIGVSSSFVCSTEWDGVDPTRLRGAALVKYKKDLKEQEKEERRKKSEAAAKERAKKTELEEAEALQLRQREREVKAAMEAIAKEERDKGAAEERQRRLMAEREAAEKLALERQAQMSSDAASPKQKKSSRADKRRLKELAEAARKEDEERKAAAVAVIKRDEDVDLRALAIARDHLKRLDPELQIPLFTLNSDLRNAVNDILLNIDFEIAKQWPHGESLVEYLMLRQDVPQGIYQLGRCFEEGFSARQDIAAAEDCFRSAASAGHEKAGERLQMLREKPASSRVDAEDSSGEQKITYEVMRHAIAGDEDAYFQIGFCYEMGYGIVQSFSEAAKWYHFSAEKDHIDAENRLAWFYKKGFGVPKDNVASAQFYKKVAKKGDRSAQCNFAIACANGDGVPRDVKKAIKLYKRSALQKYSPALFHLGCYYYLGIEVDQDVDEGLRLINAAADQGMSDAQEALRQIESGAIFVPSFISHI